MASKQPSLVPESIRRLLSKYRFEIAPDTNNTKLSCTICGKLQLDVYQTECGCTYCHSCLVNYLSDGPRPCCGTTNHCSDVSLVLNDTVRRNEIFTEKIMEAKVICPKGLCPFILELDKMEYHLIYCHDEVIHPPSISRMPSLDNSQLIECINNLKNEFEMNKVDVCGLRKEVIDQKTRIQILETESSDKQNKILALEEESRCLKNQIVLLEESLELKEIKNRMNSLEEISEVQEIQMQEIINELTKQNKLINIAAVTSKVAKEEVENMEMQLAKHINDTISHFAIINEAKNKEVPVPVTTVKDTQTQVKQADTPINSPNQTPPRKDSIDLITFIVDRFSIRKLSKDVLYSPYFYSHSNGYKLRLSVEPSGHGRGSDKYLSVFIAVCKGEHDNQLTWPCKQVFRISILNQSNGEVHYSLKFQYSSVKYLRKSLFNKPTEGDNSAYGYPTFISHSDLYSNPGLIMNDSVVITCGVTAPL